MQLMGDKNIEGSPGVCDGLPSFLKPSLKPHCRPYTAIQPFALCVVQMVPDCIGTKIWLLLGSAEMLCELLLVVTFCSQVLVLASITPITGPLGMSRAARYHL